MTKTRCGRIPCPATYRAYGVDSFTESMLAKARRAAATEFSSSMTITNRTLGTKAPFRSSNILVTATRGSMAERARSITKMVEGK